MLGTNIGLDKMSVLFFHKMLGRGKRICFGQHSSSLSKRVYLCRKSDSVKLILANDYTEIKIYICMIVLFRLPLGVYMEVCIVTYDYPVIIY